MTGAGCRLWQVRAYVERIRSFGGCSACCFVLGLRYVERLQVPLPLLACCLAPGLRREPVACLEAAPLLRSLAPGPRLLPPGRRVRIVSGGCLEIFAADGPSLTTPYGHRRWTVPTS